MSQYGTVIYLKGWYEDDDLQIQNAKGWLRVWAHKRFKFEHEEFITRHYIEQDDEYILRKSLPDYDGDGKTTTVGIKFEVKEG